jgi:hypothetical protein
LDEIIERLKELSKDVDNGCYGGGGIAEELMEIAYKLEALKDESD